MGLSHMNNNGEFTHFFLTCITTEDSIVTTLYPWYEFDMSRIYAGPSHGTEYHIKRNVTS